ncbi:alkylhydroperoxidase AhpD family core domain-containing protein [Tenacibaculum sp. MAR_2009_124]|uniref:carboxymuconolactone decarboxylase family protein n=1 Tax=Tenacibaculum sp. MAR_2009_124 TaxID=1250059 RepID=UPI00089907E6|nr:carboxymuconolactone decarboxylase family protein [Tenacibaculum sp. MAR_2009_124]SED16094.1 alkylhydroperoxidase AhpD family core domain-containing protein [Tenacibaculum sp. MAR_2009_124]
MNETKFKNIRFNPDVTPFHDLAKQMARAFGYTADLEVDKQLAQLLRLRVAQKNECAYCVILHAKTSREVGINEAKTDNISSWWNSELFTEKEKLALAYCDVLTEGTHKNFQQYHHDMTKFFSEKEIAEIAAIVINMNVWTRLKLAQGQIPYLE